MPCNHCKDEARCDRNGLCGEFRQELAKPTHKCSCCDTYYFAGDVPVLCDSCERGVPVPAGVAATAATFDAFAAQAGRNGWMSETSTEPRLNLARAAWDAALRAAGVAIPLKDQP